MPSELTIEIYEWIGRPDLITVCTDHEWGGTRIYGPKMLPGDTELIAKFILDSHAVEAITEEFAQLQDWGRADDA